MYEGIQLPNTEYQLAAVADIHSERNQTARDKWGITMTYTDPIEMFKNEDLDLVIIATPPSTHMGLALEAAKRHLHVLVQKPLARTVEEGQLMINCCRKNRVGLRVSFVRRYYPAFTKAYGLIEELGQGLLLRTFWYSSSGRKKRESKLWKEDIDTLGGVLVDLGSHVIDIARWWMGEVIDGHLSISVVKGELDNIASFLLRHESGCTTICSLSNADYQSKEIYEYVATSGGFILERKIEGYPGDWLLRVWKSDDSPKEILFEQPQENPFLVELSDYIHDLENGQLIIDRWNLGYDTLRMTTLLYQSSIQSGDMRLKEISLKDIFLRGRA
jgi:predicted dehydrogenase